MESLKYNTYIFFTCKYDNQGKRNFNSIKVLSKQRYEIFNLQNSLFKAIFLSYEPKWEKVTTKTD